MLRIDTRDPRRRRALFALLFYTVVTLLLTAPLPLHVFQTVARAIRPDVWLNLWALAWTSEHLLTDVVGLFDANIFFPHPNTLAYTDHFIGEALLGAPAYWITGSPVIAYNVAWYAALILTAWGGYLWIRCLIGDEPAGEAAALVAGAVCLLVPGKRTALSHLQVISLQGVTLALYATHSLLKRPQWKEALGLSAATTYAALCSWYTAAYVGLLLPALGVAGLALRDQTPSRRRAAIWGLAALLVTVAIMFPVALPFRAVQQEMQFERPVEELVATSLAPVDFVSSWSWLHASFMPAGSGAGGYFPGFLALGLGLLGLWAGWRRRDPWPLVYGAGALVFALLSLGPSYALSEDLTVPLPYGLLYRFVPGFGALRNPYRAAFIATLLFAAPVGYGAREVIAWWRARLLYRDRWRAKPGGMQLRTVTWILAATLAAAHLLEAWPGPQEIAALPQAQTDTYQWLSEEDPGAAALVWPLPRPIDDNARYQLWTIGNWVPLVNGHSGVYPADFVRLYDAAAAFPSPRFLAELKERFPVGYVIVHYGLVEDAAQVRELAAASDELEEVWAAGEDVVYRISNGSRYGWMRRRLPRRLLGSSIEVWTDRSAAGCDLRIVVDGELVGEARVPQPPNQAASDPAAYVFDLDVAAQGAPAAVLEIYFVEPGGLPRIELGAAMRPQRRATMAINGQAVLEAPLVVAVLDRASGRLLFERGAAADEAGGGSALRAALDAARPGDELIVAIAEELDYMLIERLRLLLTRAGAPQSDSTLNELGTTFVFRGTVGSAAGSATEAVGGESVQLTSDEGGADCRLAPIFRFDIGVPR